MKKFRKPRRGEFTCHCRAYEFPHRFSGGRCTGLFLAIDQFDKTRGGGECRDCLYNVDEGGFAACQVVNGAEGVRHCPIFLDFVALYEIKVRRI